MSVSESIIGTSHQHTLGSIISVSLGQHSGSTIPPSSWGAPYLHLLGSILGAPHPQFLGNTVRTLHETLFHARYLGNNDFLHNAVPGMALGKCLLNKMSWGPEVTFLFLFSFFPTRQDFCTEAGLEVQVSTLQPPESWDPRYEPASLGTCLSL